MNSLSDKNSRIATFAGGCFWCMQHLFDSQPGVTYSEVGYTGGTGNSPTYHDVSTGTTGHLEAIKIHYDPSKVSYKTLLETFLHHIDPTNNRGQFADIGPQYCTAVFYHDEEQKEISENTFEEILSSGQLPVIYTRILPAQKFYSAEEYHQQYSHKNEAQYLRYHMACGRDQYLKDLWKTK
jgi:methionine-S-sulfoxide reductase